MTVYARGYRRFHGERVRKGPRFLPIWLEGRRDAVKGRGYFWMRLVVVVLFVFIATFLYFQEGPLRQVVRRFREQHAAAADAELARQALLGALRSFHSASSLFVVLLTLFVGSGLVADDLRARALPLYLVRPITPFDYYLGKLLIPVTVLATVVLVPGLALVLFASFLRPSEESLSFLAHQSDLVGGLLAHYAFLATYYASVVLLFSCWTARRLSAVILGTLVFFGAEIVGGVVARLHGPLVEALRAASPMAGTYTMLDVVVGSPVGFAHGPPPPTLGAALVAWAFVVLLAAGTVVRRARTTEVVA